MSTVTERALPIVHKPGCAKPDVRTHCKCGANRSCASCGWGNGQYPCACTPLHKFGNA